MPLQHAPRTARRVPAHAPVQFAAPARPFASRAWTGPSPAPAASGHDLSRIAVSAAGLGPRAGGRPLPDAVRGKMERAFGEPFADVRVHEDHAAAEAGAFAFTRGSHIHVAPGHYRPESARGQRLLGHELAHVVQQRRGHVRPTLRVGRLAASADPTLEAAAEAAGTRAALGRPAVDASPGGHAAGGPGGGEPVVQGFWPLLAAGALGVGAYAGWKWWQRRQRQQQPPKPMDALSRLRRAHDREAARQAVNPPPKLGKRRDVDTGFGTVGLSRQPFHEDPRISSRADDFPGTNDPGEKYVNWGPPVQGLGSAAAMAAVVDQQPGNLTAQQQRSAAMLVGATQHAEDYRFPNAKKAARSGMRRVKAGRRTYMQTFGPGGDFPMAEPGGARAYHQALGGERELTAEQRALLEEMSDSSDEE